MDIFLKTCTSHNGFVIDYTIYKDSTVVGFLCFDDTTHRWKMRVSGSAQMTLIDVGAAWSLLINRLGLEKT